MSRLVARLLTLGWQDKKSAVKKKGAFDWGNLEPDPVPEPPPAAPAPAEDDFFGGSWDTGKKGKDKKGKKGAVVEEIPPPPPVAPVVEEKPPEDDWFSGFGKKVCDIAITLAAEY